MKRLALILTTVLFNIFTIYFLSYASDNIIYGCFKKNEGQLRIVKQGSRCLPSEVPISWNQAGLPGPAGPAGPAGPQGPPGAPCTDCANGSSITVREIATGCAGGYGWCPDGFKWTFRILDTAVNPSSVIAMNIVNPGFEDFGCEVATKGIGEFFIMCIGADYVSPGATLQYAVFNP